MLKKLDLGFAKVDLTCMMVYVLKTKYFTCCKEGHKPAKMYYSKAYCNESSKSYYKRRKRPTIRCGCRAHLQLTSVDDVIFEVHDFIEGHNLNMVADIDMQFVRSTRKLTHVQEEAIYELSNLNLGPVKALNLMRTQYGDFERVGETKDGCKNFKHGLNFYIGEYDAEMIVQRLHKMIFVPFMATDNLCHSVTVSAGLLASETIESYTWLLQMLLKSFGSAPKVVVTGQDPSMKQAIASMFPNTRHRCYVCGIS
ncbi:protein FAR1-RELATED SEQUENCE 5-like [Bidens hawaiensis]|uniref:protein FAR1-RELATED SEQUENCE 5-like n=1 Tax=Bidens hawaiensis TaxID=980011 RepID=UPI004048F266